MKEEEIRKRDVFNKYLALVEKDVKDFFNFSSFEKVYCPACQSDDLTLEFKKLGFSYTMCGRCFTFFVNPRPPYAVLKKFYSCSPSTNFWVNEFFKPVEEARREKIFRPRAEYICEFMGKPSGKVIGDIGAGFGLFLEEMRKIIPENTFVAIEPSVEMVALCKEKKLDTLGLCLEDIEENICSFDILTAFELTEHLYDPAKFFKKVFDLLKPGGYTVLTTLNGRGFDILILGDKSKSVSPPHHLNFFNPVSISILLERIGFEIVEITTPGKLDWDIVEGMIKNEGYNAGAFWGSLAKESGNECKEELQAWIAKNNLSSHMRVIAKKP